MKEGRLRRNWIVPVFVLAVAALASGLWRYGYGQALDQLARRAEADLALASDRLSTQLQVYQELAVMLAPHPALSDLDSPEGRAAAAIWLREVADKTSAMDVFFADASGRVLTGAVEPAGADISATPYFRRALQGALGSVHGLEKGRRAYFYAAPAFGRDKRVRGALVIVADVGRVEQAWRGDSPAVFFTDAAGEVFISNRSELMGWSRPAGGAGLVPADGRQSHFNAAQVGPHEIWNIGWGPYLPRHALHMMRDLPVIGLRGEVLVDVSPARRLAGLQAAAVAAICLAFGALLFLATVRRRTLAQANAVLEAEVARRTAALSDANANLRREVTEREDAEATLKKAQADLVQAGKLSALGKMSAGISHELNQPLMAIGTFAENGLQYLERGRPDVAAENLGRIADLGRRMARIIQNLRAFARQESEASGRVDICKVLDSVIEMAMPRMRQEEVKLQFNSPDGPVWVRGGEVRLGQVFLNLVSNAIDAMQDSPAKVLSVALRQDEVLTVEVRDTGPGIDDPEKVFDPFYTTKEVGGAEGMGLGLSISYGIVQSFGGDIRGRNINGPMGGALFSVRLEHWKEDVAA